MPKLPWPAGWPRTPDHERKSGDFHKMAPTTKQDGSAGFPRKVGLQWHEAWRRVREEVERMGGEEADAASNESDPGVVVHFRLKGKPVVMPCDRYDTKAQNLAAIAATIFAKRAIERHGVSTLEREFQGYVALPETASAGLPPLHVILEVAENAGPDVYRAAWKAWVVKNHPDRCKEPGAEDRFARVNAAYTLHAGATA